jgi:hypothetical protein
MKTAVILGVFLGLILALLIGIMLVSTAGCTVQQKADPNSVYSFTKGGGESGQPFRFLFSKANTLFFVLVLLMVAGLIMALALKMSEGCGVALSGAAGAVFVVAIASWGVWIGLAAIAGVIIYIVLKLKLFKNVSTLAVKYAEGLKALSDKEKVEAYNKEVYQPLAVRKVVAEIKTEK